MPGRSTFTPSGTSTSPPRPATHPLAARAALEVLLVKAVEEADVETRVIGPAERSRAAREARGTDDPVEAIVRRAHALMPVVIARRPSFRWLPRDAALPAWLAGAVVVAAAAAGLAGNLLGPAARINVLAVPVLALLAWNAGVYVALSAGALARRAATGSRSLASLWAAVAARLAERGRRMTPGEAASAGDGATIRSYLEAWQRVALPPLVAGARALLHLGAAAVAAGLALGMYVRGIVFEYRATWESTFLGPAEVHAFLMVVLGPAAALLRRTIPSPEMLAQIRAPASGEAAGWVHLYAASVLIWVILPRLALAALAARRARRRAASVALDLAAPYFRRLVAEHRGEAAAVDVLPYSYALSGAAAERLRQQLQTMDGTPVELRLAAPLPYGADAAEAIGALPPANNRAERWLALVVNAAQPPEPEVHGELLRELLDLSGRSGRRLVLVVDSSDYVRRLGEGPVAARRLAERRQSWDRAAASAGVIPLHLDLSEPARALADQPA